jgi:hypothetical protein
MIRHCVLAFLIGLFAGVLQLHAQQFAAPHPYSADALVGKWVSDDADRIPVEFRADGSFNLAVSKTLGSSYPAGWKWETAEGTYMVAEGGRVEYTAKLGGRTIRGHFTMKDAVLVHPTGANYRTRWTKMPKSSDSPCP